MKIKNINESSYKIFLNYIYKKCNLVSFEKYANQHYLENKKVLEVILKSKKYNLNYLINNYSNKLLNEVFKAFKNNENIFDEKYVNEYEANNYRFNDNNLLNKIKWKNRKIVILDAIDWLVYDMFSSNWINQYKKNIVFTQNIKDSDIYFFYLNGEIKKEIKNKNSIFDWHFPMSLDNICFYKKNGLRWLLTVSHEKICEICFQKDEEKEYEYLKSIGIEFVEEEFTPTPKEYLYYLE